MLPLPESSRQPSAGQRAAPFAHLETALDLTMRCDRERLRRQLAALRQPRRGGKPAEQDLARLVRDLERSVATREARQARLPKVRFDEELPIFAKRAEIAEAIRNHPVVIVSGETGCGKSTQLPKICLELGRGVAGLVGHTQPRRIAARSIAARVAEELGVSLGQEVGFKIRFTDSTSPRTYVKLMTDGILLAELQSDRFLDQYDTILIDEAHERSLNIDFLLGYLKRLLPKRPDLKLVITSATIDSERFARHFASPRGPAPVIEVSGRTYPVEVRYRPLEPDEDGVEPDLQEAVLAAVRELARIDTGDILVFMPTERDIHETAKSLRGQSLPWDDSSRRTEIVPLYARLPAKEQARIFQAHPHRRIVIATNVAESSLTVPGVRYVVDTGTARISRYSARSKTQRLPIEAVSQASADQRKGRSGRVAPGICIRLFSEQDYLARDRYTMPEIQRTNLASVILQAKAMKLGDLEGYPFLDPPKPVTIRDGYKTLFELGALDQREQLTDLGRRLSRLPVDPRIGRMILAAEDENCLGEVLIIAAALELQDPRERPLEKREAADACHAQFADAESDFLGYLKLWDFFHGLKAKLSRNQLRKACGQNFLSFNRMSEWLEIHRQLLQLVGEAGLRPRARRDEYPAIHRAILTGLLSNLGCRGETYEYNTAGGGKFHVWPGSAMFKKKPKWLVAAELVETSRRYLRTCAKIDPAWVEPLAAHLVKRTYSEPGWDRETGSATAVEKVSLFGLTIVPRRRVCYGPIDPARSRELMIRHGLVEGEIDLDAEFFHHNRKLVEEVEAWQRKLRRQDLFLGEWECFEFYDRRIPADVYDVARLKVWLGEARRAEPRVLFMSRADVAREEVDEAVDVKFPDALGGPTALPLEYQFLPGAEDDGVTVTAPLEVLNQLDADRLGWLVPGLLEQKITALIKSLPKPIRRRLVPAPDVAKKAAAEIRFGEGCFLAALAALLGRMSEQHIPPEAFEPGKLPPELLMNVRVLDDQGGTLAAGRDLEALRRQLGAEAAERFSGIDDAAFNRDGIVAWDFDELPELLEFRRRGMTIQAFPALVDRGESVSLRLADSADRAREETRLGLVRLYSLAARGALESQVQWLPDLEKMVLYAAHLEQFNVKRHLAELIAERAFVAEQPTPRSRAQFEEQLATGRGRIALAVQDVAAVVSPLLAALHEARLSLEQASAPKCHDAAADVRRQLARLTEPGFLTATPWCWLRHFPRYLRAIHLRLENVRTGDHLRDREHLEEIAAWEDAWLQRAERHAAMGIYDAELVQFRWMLEEYRVSLFAQRLGTAAPVSGKRLEKLWAKVQA